MSSLRTLAQLDALRWMHGMIDAASAAVLATGVPVSEMWLEHATAGIEIKLMRHVGGVPAVGEYSRGEVVARVWMDGLQLRYDGIELGAGWAIKGAQA